MLASFNHAVDDGSEIIPVSCAVAASSWVSIRASDLAGLRARVAAAFPETLSIATLKQTDEQCLVALLGLKEALDGAMPSKSERWALVACPRTLGRKRISESIDKFRENGAWSVSPHLIPNLSLHSMPGLLSQAIRLHGPNLGAGGMPGVESEIIWTTMPFLDDQEIQGVWLVLSGWNHEGPATDSAFCQAAVLGLRRGAAPGCQARLSFIPGTAALDHRRFTLEAVGAAIRDRSAMFWDVGGAVCCLSWTGSGMEAAA